MFLSDGELFQLNLLKQKTSIERFLLMVQLIEGQIKIMKTGLKLQNPTLNEKELEKCRKEKMMKIYSSRH